ncbi:extracellular catalytic domain type 2 short-chain-length polyhydroxyalkanoate depolymerase [Beggiatoa alba]|nr:poly(3-hydroxybutyrate) depolymerase [Beggiatoa alba]
MSLKTLTVATSLILSFPIYAETVKLPSYQADLSQTTVSGISSGAFMAAQLGVAYSAEIKGIATIGGGLYYCAGSGETKNMMDYIMTSINTCMKAASDAPPPNPEKALEKAKTLASAHQIDDLANVKAQKVYLFSGTNDKVVNKLVMDKTLEFYQLAGVAKEQIKYITDVPSGHAFVTNNPDDLACETTAPPFISKCGFFQSHQLLQHLYTDLKPAVEAGKTSGTLVSFDQKEFLDSDKTSMADVAYVYVPKTCESTACKVHIAVHGCTQSAIEIGDKFYTRTRFNEMADANNLIILYPQVLRSTENPMNPKGCWDFWGYSSPNPDQPDFFSKEAPQMRAIMKMVKRLGETKVAH